MTLSQVIHRHDAKELGAYYTSEAVASFLVGWAVRQPTDHILDPSFGDGVFLEAAMNRLAAVGGAAAKQVHGVELNAEVFRHVSRATVCSAQLQNGDFFDYSCRGMRVLPQVDAVVGNPPFIRYQRFAGVSRNKALYRAKEEGVVLSQLTSSWAPFVVHSSSMLRRGGRLAMVVPYEIVYARYAKPVLKYLASNFAAVNILTFEEPLFPDLNEATVLLLADKKGEGPAEKLTVRYLASPRILHRELDSIRCRTIEIDANVIADDEERFATLHLPREYRDLYAAAREFCAPLGAFADVGIGYVTGANDFFHLSPDAVRQHSLPASVLAPAVCRGSAFRGSFFTNADWKHGLENGASAYLLKLGERKLSPAVERYLRVGEALGVTQRYKCRTRSPWYRVPHIHRGDAFLTYMSGQRPRLVANDAAVFAPNTLHVVRLKRTPVSGRALSLLWQTSIARLSAQLEGHAMGGGMLKLEPREAERILLPDVADSSSFEDAAAEIDRLLRAGLDDQARRLADEATLEQHGFTPGDCDRLARAAEMMIQRRCKIPRNVSKQRAQTRRTVGPRHGS